MFLQFLRGREISRLVFRREERERRERGESRAHTTIKITASTASQQSSHNSSSNNNNYCNNNVSVMLQRRFRRNSIFSFRCCVVFLLSLSAAPQIFMQPVDKLLQKAASLSVNLASLRLKLVAFLLLAKKLISSTQIYVQRSLEQQNNMFNCSISNVSICGSSYYKVTKDLLCVLLYKDHARGKTINCRAQRDLQVNGKISALSPPSPTASNYSLHRV